MSNIHECPICLETLSCETSSTLAPVGLICGHFLCMGCLNSICSTARKEEHLTICCHLCRTELSLSIAETLAVSFGMCQLLKLTQSIPSSTPSSFSLSTSLNCSSELSSLSSSSTHFSNSLSSSSSSSSLSSTSSLSPSSSLSSTSLSSLSSLLSSSHSLNSTEIKNTDASAEKCSKCKLVNFSVYCSDCDLCFCESCSNKVHLHQSLQQHSKLFVFGSINYPICSEHGEFCKIFCRKCNKEICQKCTESHETHETTTIHSHILDSRNIMTDCLSKFEKQLQQIDDIKHQVHKQINGVHNHVNSVYAVIQEQESKLVSLIRERFQELQSCINDMNSVELSKTDSFLNELNIQSEKIDSEILQTRSLLSGDQYIRAQDIEKTQQEMHKLTKQLNAFRPKSSFGLQVLHDFTNISNCIKQNWIVHYTEPLNNLSATFDEKTNECVVKWEDRVVDTYILECFSKERDWFQSRILSESFFRFPLEDKQAGDSIYFRVKFSCSGRESNFSEKVKFTIPIPIHSSDDIFAEYSAGHLLMSNCRKKVISKLRHGCALGRNVIHQGKYTWCLKLNKCQNVGIGIIALNSLHSMDDKSYSCPGAVLLFNRYSAWVKGEYSPLGENIFFQNGDTVHVELDCDKNIMIITRKENGLRTIFSNLPKKTSWKLHVYLENVDDEVEIISSNS